MTMMIIEGFSAIAAALAIAGAILLNYKVRRCFLLWMVSNSMCLAIHLHAALWSLAGRDVAFFVLAVIGWIKWAAPKKAEKLIPGLLAFTATRRRGILRLYRSTVHNGTGEPIHTTRRYRFPGPARDAAMRWLHARLMDGHEQSMQEEIARREAEKTPAPTAAMSRRHATIYDCGHCRETHEHLSFHPDKIDHLGYDPLWKAKCPTTDGAVYHFFQEEAQRRLREINKIESEPQPTT